MGSHTNLVRFDEEDFVQHIKLILQNNGHIWVSIEYYICFILFEIFERLKHDISKIIKLQVALSSVGVFFNFFSQLSYSSCILQNN